MLLTVSTTHQPATDLGYLLHKNPARTQTEELSFGSAQVFYPVAEEGLCTAALLVDVDPIALVRGRGPAGEGGQLSQYVNDRPYAANSFLSVAIGRVFASAMGGRSKDRPELAATALPLTAHLPVIAARGGHALVRRLFEPLGYTVELTSSQLDESFPAWGRSPYVGLTLTGMVRLQDLLTHLYVLIPVLDNEKHYWISTDEIDKLLKRGEGWLGGHPERELIVARYLGRRRSLAREALARLVGEEDETEELVTAAEARTPTLHQQRLESVFEALKATGAKRVLDLGCGEGKLLRLLMDEPQFAQILGMDVSWRALEIARDRLNFEHLPERRRARIDLIHGSLTYRDARLAGFDAAAVVEVIEHLDPFRMAAFERILFECARPAHILLTTPNADYNVAFPTLPTGQLRHAGHRFEWSREQFEQWAGGVAMRHGYTVTFAPLGPIDEGLGAPTQMAHFSVS